MEAQSKPDETFRQAVIQEILKSGFQNPGTKIGNDAVKATMEYVRMFAVEALMRSRDVAQGAGDTVIETQHLEKILAQLLLDF